MRLAVLVPAVILSAAPATWAQQPTSSPSPPVVVEQVTVAADRAEERRDPVSFTNLDRAQIETMHRGQDLAALVSDVPGAYAYSDAGNGVGYAYLSLRGFDQRRIAVTIDGVPLNTAETHQVYFVDLADFAAGLDNVQVQRGTGTALYGSPAVGGALNLETAPARSLVGTEAALTAGSFGTTRAWLRHAGASRDGRYAWLARLSRIGSAGYRERASVRHLLAQVSVERYGERSALRLAAFGGPERTELAFTGVTADYLSGAISGDRDADRRVNFLHPGEIDTYTQPHVRLTHDWAASAALSVRSTAYAILGSGAYRQFDAGRDVVTDFAADGRPADIRAVAAAWRRRAIDERRLGLIPRLRWQQAHGTLDAGVEASVHRAHHDGALTDGVSAGTPLALPFSLYNYRTEKDSLSVFARQTLAVMPELSLSAELSATTHRYAMRRDLSRGFSFDGRYSWLTPRFGVNWNKSPAFGMFAAVAGARSEPAFRDIWDPQDPDSDPRAAFARVAAAGRQFTEPRARPESLFDLEAGATLAIGRGRLRLAAYRMRFRDELVFAGGLDDDGNPLTANAGRSIHQGLELALRAPLGGGVDLDGYVSASSDRLSALVLRSVDAAGQPVAADYSGNRVALFPRHLARLRLARTLGPLRVAFGARHVGRLFTDNSENERKTPAARAAEGYVNKFVDPGLTLDAQATWRVGKRLRLQAFGENLGNRRFTTFGYSYPNDDFSGFYSEFFPAATRGVYLGASWDF